MTDKQMDKMRNELNKMENGEYKDRMFEELSARRMINSILIYGNINSADEGQWSHERYLKPFYEGDTWRNKGLITRERMLELIEEQKEDIRKAEIGFAGYDSEGVSYNYCKWADD